ncbi:MAG: indolepyruvate ferredoxin oxidoreductase subunit alpha [Burkholderiales bacterium]|nr:indolepyruvate ferredoxin oxidoreductase subunit alpha [Burkholderiales bacterium]
MERSFKEEIKLLRLAEGEVFHGEGILAVTKALLQSGVSYVGGYQGAPISHLIDVLADARELMDEMGIHFEANASEAGAAAMLSASINYPVRGAVTWKSTVGTNVASDALANLASSGVKGGAVIIIGEDYGEGSSIMQERSHAFAMKSQIWLLDPRPTLPSIVRAVEKAFELSEASNTPVMVELRIRACHVHGAFTCKDNRAPAISRAAPLTAPSFDYGNIVLPPSSYAQEKHKIEKRWPAALEFIRREGLNEVIDGVALDGAAPLADIGILTQGGLTNAVLRALAQLGLADAHGASRVPVYVMNVTYPLVPEELTAFCAGKRAVLMVEEGQPAYLEDALGAVLRRADLNTRVYGKEVPGQPVDTAVFPLAGEYTGEVMQKGIAAFLRAAAPALPGDALAAPDAVAALKRRAAELLGAPVPNRPPGFCIGCPERPVFSAMKLLERESGGYHVSADIGCHLFSSLPPFNIGNTVLGYGLGLASNSAIGPLFNKRSLTVMGDGGFWHNGLSSGVSNAVFNNDDGILVIMKNGYSSATGTQELPSSPHQSQAHRATDMGIEKTLAGMGVKWLKVVDNYRVSNTLKVLREAMTTPFAGLKVIVAEGECQLERQRRLRPINAEKLRRGERVLRVRYGVDEDTCTGDHSCIRLSGCPSLTIKDSSDPLRVDPVAHVNNNCVGCGLCGEVSHAATLCPSFYRAEIVHNPGWWDRLKARLRAAVIGVLQPA